MKKCATQWKRGLKIGQSENFRKMLTENCPTKVCIHTVDTVNLIAAANHNPILWSASFWLAQEITNPNSYNRPLQWPITVQSSMPREDKVGQKNVTCTVAPSQFSLKVICIDSIEWCMFKKNLFPSWNLEIFQSFQQFSSEIYPQKMSRAFGCYA
jgi:hypothetical protein